MKKVLIGTTALVAAGLFAASGAQAADPIKLGLGGFMTNYIGYADQGNDTATSDQSTIDIKTNTEIYVVGSTKLDNGMTVGAHMQIEADQGSSGMDHTNMFLTSPDFGTITLGSTGYAHADHTAGRSAPEVAEGINWGDLDEWFDTGSVSKAAGSFTVTDSTTVKFKSASFGGFAFGASYTPSTAKGDSQVDSKTEDSATSFGASYGGAFDNVSVSVGVGYTKSDSAAAADTNMLTVGGTVGYAGFSVGGTYAKVDTDGGLTFMAAGAKYWDIGVAYRTGPYGMSVAYSQGTVKSTTNDDENTYINFGGSYALGPGVSLKGGLVFADYVDDGVDYNDGWAAYTGLALSF